MDTKKLLTADYLDIIYDQRNKLYGGYELRRHYDQRLRKAVLFSLTGVAALLSFSFISANHNGKPVNTLVTKVYDMKDMKPLTSTPPPPKIIPPTPPPPAQHLKTNPFTPPVITDDMKVDPDKLMTENKKLANTQPGISVQDGDSASISPVTTTGRPGNGTGVIKVGNGKPDEPVRLVQQMPEFIGDMSVYLGRNLRYPEAARSAGIEGRVVVEFIVNENGAVSNAHVVRGIGGGCDDEALRIVSAMPKWKPGKQNGTAVKVYFVLPILFQLN